MTHSQPHHTGASTRSLPPAAQRLLRQIARHDTGNGVTFEHAPAGRWLLAGTSYRVNDRTFHPLDAAGLIDVGDGHADPVRMTSAGRRYLLLLDEQEAA